MFVYYIAMVVNWLSFSWLSSDLASREWMLEGRCVMLFGSS